MTVNSLIPASAKPSEKNRLVTQEAFFLHVVSVHLPSNPLALQNHKHGLLIHCSLFSSRPCTRLMSSACCILNHQL